MANIDFAPVLCRLLADLMLDGVATLRGFDWGVAAMHHFLPRVRVGRAVLSVARWRMTETFLKYNFCLDSPAAFRRSLNRWQTNWKVPRYVHLTEADNRLVLDLHNNIDIEDLLFELRQVSPQQAVTHSRRFIPACRIHGSMAQPGDLSRNTWFRWLSAQTAAVSARPFRPTVRRAARIASPSTADRVKAPGSQWLYIKLYTAPSLEDDLLTGPIRQLIFWAREAETMRRWFFIRYADPQPHIRLRFRGRSCDIGRYVAARNRRLGAGARTTDVCLRFAVDTYEREIDRYGGIHAIATAEELFFHDSEFALTALAFLGPQCYLQRHELAMFGLDVLLADLGWDIAKRADFFKAIDAVRQNPGPSIASASTLSKRSRDCIRNRRSPCKSGSCQMRRARNHGQYQISDDDSRCWTTKVVWVFPSRRSLEA